MLLGIGELVDVDAHGLQLEGRHPLFDLGIDVVDAGLEWAGLLHQPLGYQGLGGEAHVHDAGGVPFGGGEVNQTAAGQEEDAPPVGQDVLVDVAPDLLMGGGGQLLTRDSTDSYPAWSPDGRFLIFASRGRTGDWEIYRHSPADDETIKLTDRLGTDVTPIVSPDGLEVYFRTDVAGGWQIRAVSIDGRRERAIVGNIGHSDDWGLARPAVDPATDLV